MILEAPFTLIYDVYSTGITYDDHQWNSTFFAFSLIIEGTTEKVLQFIMLLKTIYNGNFGFIEQKKYF
jgi:hypothetical protein